MLEMRLSKLAVTVSLALFALLCGIDNVIDYASNLAFVTHVMSMDTTFPENALKSRALTAPDAHRVAYLLIIAAELAIGACLAAASVAMTRRLRAPPEAFDAAKRLFVAGATLGFLLWFTGFTAIGGEWFAMWQSARWNGQEPAFRFYITLLAALCFVCTPERSATWAPHVAKADGDAD